MGPVRKDDFEIIESVATAFVKNVVSKSGKSSDEARKAFMENANLMTKVKMLSANVRYKLTKTENYDKRAELLVRNCELALPVLMKVYGRELLVDAMKATPGRSRNLADIVRFKGAFGVSSLVRKSLRQKPEW